MEQNITWCQSHVSRPQRQRLMGQRPAVVWFTGLSGSGKSTVAAICEKSLCELGYKAYLIDGDNVRHGLNCNLGFSDDDRAENIRRIAQLAATVADSGMIALVSAISPMREMRRNAREITERLGIDFIEVFASATVDDCAARDPKGLYKKAFAGEIKGFTGVDAPYEVPKKPDIIIDTVRMTAQLCASAVTGELLRRQISYDRLLSDLIPLAVRAGDAIMEIYDSPDLGISYKDDKSPLTAADKASNEIIIEGLSRLYPQFAYLTEESADDRSRLCERWCFIVDPLDGTKEFIKHNGEFTVNIALSHDHESVAGVIYVPATREVYYAARGCGAFRTRGGVTERIHVSERTSDIVVMESRSHNTPALEELLAKNAAKISRRIGAGSSLKGCRVAEGVADIYYRCGPTMEWDTAAMQIICEEAGAIFRQYDGYDSPMYYNRTHTRNDLGFYILNRAENKL